MAATMAQALNTALRDALDADERVVVFGEDVGRLGGVFRITDGLADTFGDRRCFDTPVAEAGIAGLAVGMAMAGFRPVVEMQFDAFAYPAFEQIASHVAKFRNRTRGTLALPMVVRIPYGGGIGGVEHHSDSSEAYYAHTAGLKVVTPATVGDAYSLLREAIEDPDPVIFLEPKRQYWTKEDIQLPLRSQPFGTAAVRRRGTDATLVAYGPSVAVALAAAREAAAEGLDVEVLDLRTLVPLDDHALTESVRRTGRCLVVHESQGFAGVGAEIAARVQESCFDALRAPVLRVTGLDIPYPPPLLENAHLPGVHRVLAGLRRLLPDGGQGVRHPLPAFAVTPAAGGRTFLLPDLGEGLAEAEVLEWTVAVGDSVTHDQPVVEVETAKSVITLPTPFAGTVTALHCRAGEIVEVGAPLLSVTETAPEADSGAVLTGYGTGGARRRAVGNGAAPTHGTGNGAAPGGPGAPGVPGAPGAPGAPSVSSVLSAPDASGVLDMRGVQGVSSAPDVSGVGGASIVPGVSSPPPKSAVRQPGVSVPSDGVAEEVVRARRDTHGACDVPTASSVPEVPGVWGVPSAPATSAVRQPGVSVPSDGVAEEFVRAHRDTDSALDVPSASSAPGVRGAPSAPSAPTPSALRAPGLRLPLGVVAEKFLRAHRDTPAVTIWADADATNLLAARDACGTGLLPLLARAAIAGLAAFPALNARVDEGRSEIVRLPQVHLGFAAQTEEGLVVPVVRDADRLPLDHLATELRRLTDLARRGVLPAEHRTGGTFTLNNYGVLGVDGATPLLNHPQTAMLGIGRLVERPWAVDGRVEVREIVQLSLTFDHRVCDGGTAAGFLRRVIDGITAP